MQLEEVNAEQKKIKEMVNKTKKLIFLNLIFVFIFISILNVFFVSAVANSSNYTVSSYGISVVGSSSAEGDSLEARNSLTYQTTGNANSSSYNSVIGFFGEWGTTKQIEAGFTGYLTGTDEVTGGDNYSLIIEVKDALGNHVNASSLPKIRIYDSLKNLIVDNVDATYFSSGIYKYNFTTSTSHITGEWEANVSITKSGETKYYFDYWDLINNPTELSISSVSTSSSSSSISANIVVTNEGATDYEYSYEYCIVSTASGQCSDSNVVSRATGSKLIGDGESWSPTLTLNVNQPGNYWFKVIFYYNDDRSGASRSFTASYTESSSGSGGDSGSSSGSSGSAPITGETILRPEYLMDAKLSILKDYKIVHPGDKIIASVTFLNLGTENVEDAYLTYCINDNDDTFNPHNISSCTRETVAVQTKIQLIKTFVLPNNIDEGIYYYSVDVNYKNATAHSSDSFEIVKEEIVVDLPNVKYDLSDIILFATFIIIIFSFMFFIFMAYLIYSKISSPLNTYREKLRTVYVNRKENRHRRYRENDREYTQMERPSENRISEKIKAVYRDKIKFLKKKRKSDRVSEVIGMKVYSSHGMEIGVIKEVYLEDYKIYGWVIEPNRKISRKLKKLNKRDILIRHHHILSIKDIVIIDEKVLEHLEENYRENTI